MVKKYLPRYKIKKLYTDTYSISDNGLNQFKVFMYLLIGEKKALLIDSGFGLLDIKKTISLITDREIICALTHGHIDHVLGAGVFENAYLNSRDFGVYQKNTDPTFIREFWTKGPVKRPPKRYLKNHGYLELVESMARKKYPFPKPLDDIGEFDLGNRTVSWRLVPGHTGGSVALVDENYNTVFDSVSTIYGGLVFFPESSHLREYLNTLENYVMFIKERCIEKRYTMHHDKPLKLNNLLSLSKCVKTAIKNPKKGIAFKTPYGNARAVFSGRSVLLHR